MRQFIEIENKGLREEPLPDFSPGDQVEVKVRIREGEKSRIQAFVGTVIRRRGAGVQANFCVRRIVAGEGVERTFLVNSPNVVDIKVRRRGQVRRAKLYYLRDRVGKATRVKEKREPLKTTGKKKAKQPPKQPPKEKELEAVSAES